jgi:hypothetical protein
MSQKEDILEQIVEEYLAVVSCCRTTSSTGDPDAELLVRKPSGQVRQSRKPAVTVAQNEADYAALIRPTR